MVKIKGKIADLFWTSTSKSVVTKRQKRLTLHNYTKIVPGKLKNGKKVWRLYRVFKRDVKN